MDSGLAWTVWKAAAYFGKGDVPRRNGTAHRAAAPYQGYKTKDSFILIGAANQKLWEKLCLSVVQKPEWINDERFLTNSIRVLHVDELEVEIQNVLIKNDSSYWLNLLDKHGIPSGPIYSYDQTLSDEHILSREMVLDYEQPIAGAMKTFGFPAKFSETPGQFKNPAPLLVQHNKEILVELGYSEAEIETFLTNSVLKN